VFLGAAVISLGGLGLIALIRPEGQELRTGQSVRRTVLAEIGEGLRAIRENRGALLIIELFVAQAFVRGALNVFAVVAALGVLDMGDAGVGQLTAAVGAGGLVGSAFSVSLVGRRLGLPLATGLVLWGLPLVVVGARAKPSVALAALAVIGIGNAILDVAGLTLLQRLVPDAVLGRVVGLLVGAATAAIGVGSIVTPEVISALGIRGAMAVVGGSLVLCALIALPRLRRLDRSAGSAAPEAGLVRRTPMFASLSVAATEHLASRLQDVDVTAGTELIREGEQGDCFYLIADGDFDVTAGGRFVARLGPGDHFGEIALLREVRRTATVTAVTRGRVEAVDRAGFVAAVFGHAVSAASANESIDRRLAELRRVASDGG
jgi:hypothetical protein